MLLGQLLFYGAAVIGYELRHSPWGRIKLFYGPLYFCLANTAALVGWCSLFSNRHIVTWQPHRVAAESELAIVPGAGARSGGNGR